MNKTRRFARKEKYERKKKNVENEEKILKPRGFWNNYYKDKSYLYITQWSSRGDHQGMPRAFALARSSQLSARTLWIIDWEGIGSDQVNISFRNTTLIQTDTIYASMTTFSWSSIISGMILWSLINGFVVSCN